MVGRQKLNGVAQALDLPGLVVGRPAGFQQYGGGGPVGEEWKQLGAGQALSQTDAAGFLGDGDFENGLCQVDGDGRMLLHGLLLQKEWL
jgi:hypothetical protein